MHCFSHLVGRVTTPLYHWLPRQHPERLPERSVGHLAIAFESLLDNSAGQGGVGAVEHVRRVVGLREARVGRDTVELLDNLLEVCPVVGPGAPHQPRHPGHSLRGPEAGEARGLADAPAHPNDPRLEQIVPGHEMLEPIGLDTRVNILRFFFMEIGFFEYTNTQI